jgi:pyruvate dehydrogenase E1 component
MTSAKTFVWRGLGQRSVELDMTHLSSGVSQLQTLGLCTPRNEDDDPQETAVWLDALGAAVQHVGKDRAQYLSTGSPNTPSLGVDSNRAQVTPYRNSIAAEEEPRYPGDLDPEEKLAGALRWNALAMVVRANRACGELCGHIASVQRRARMFKKSLSALHRTSRAFAR